MDKRGFTLLELIVVVAITGILLTVAMLSFNNIQRTSLVERQVKELYTDIQDARLKSAFNKQPHDVVFGAQSVTFRRFSSAGDALGTVVLTKNLSFPITRTAWSSPSDGRIVFDTKGVSSDPIIKVICVTTTADAPYDALIISPTLTNLGKVTNRGTACGETNVTQK